jgi:hypothetical protein
MLLALVVMTSTAFGDIGPVARSTSLDGTGSLQSGSEEKFYIYVKNVSNGTLADGAVVVLDTSADDGYSVTTSTTAGATPICIIAREGGRTCADDQLCRCQTYGLNDGVQFDATTDSHTAGQSAFISESNAGYVMGTLFTSVAASDKPVGVFYDTGDTSGDVQLFIKLR